MSLSLEQNSFEYSKYNSPLSFGKHISRIYTELFENSGIASIVLNEGSQENSAYS